MTVASTSRAAYQSVKNKLGFQQKQVYDTVERLGVVSNEGISLELRLPINVVTPRVNELVRLGFLGFEKFGQNLSGRKAKQWSVRHPNDLKQLSFIEQECED